MSGLTSDQNKKKLVIFGLGDFADIAYEYFTHDSEYEVVAFTVNEKYKDADTHQGLPVLSFENIGDFISPRDHSFFAAVLYKDMNDLRKNVAQEAKEKGFGLASYISSRAFVWGNVEMGEHNFIFEDNTIQPFVSIGFNNIFWSGNHVGHHSSIGDNCFISSHVVISGTCKILGNTFIGVNSTISNNVSIGERTWIGPSAIITKDITAGSLVLSAGSKVRPLDEIMLQEKLDSISVSRKATDSES